MLSKLCIPSTIKYKLYTLADKHIINYSACQILKKYKCKMCSFFTFMFDDFLVFKKLQKFKIHLSIYSAWDICMLYNSFDKSTKCISDA